MARTNEITWFQTYPNYCLSSNLQWIGRAFSSPALKATPEPTHWVSDLPLVLFGICAGLKQDIRCSTAELVYGTSHTMLRLPGEFFSVNTDEHPDSTSYVSKLKTIMSKLHPPKTRQVNRPSYVSDTLSTCTHVFVRRDAVKKPL